MRAIRASDPAYTQLSTGRSTCAHVMQADNNQHRSGELVQTRRAQRNREAAHRSRAKHKERTKECESAARRALALHDQLRRLLDFLVNEIGADGRSGGFASEF